MAASINQDAMSTVVRTSTAVGYFRVSSPGHAGARHVSLESQVTQFHSYCLANDLEPVKTFTDIASGRKNNRQEYRSMLDYVTMEHIGNVVVSFLDRFGRNPQELLPLRWGDSQAVNTTASEATYRNSRH